MALAGVRSTIHVLLEDVVAIAVCSSCNLIFIFLNFELSSIVSLSYERYGISYLTSIRNSYFCLAT